MQWEKKVRKILQNRLWIILSLIAILVFLGGCAKEKGTPEGQGQETAGKLKIAVLPIEDTMPLLVAEKNGYFRAENLDVELVSFQNPVEQSNAMPFISPDCMALLCSTGL